MARGSLELSLCSLALHGHSWSGQSRDQTELFLPLNIGAGNLGEGTAVIDTRVQGAAIGMGLPSCPACPWPVSPATSLVCLGAHGPSAICAHCPLPTALSPGALCAHLPCPTTLRPSSICAHCPLPTALGPGALCAHFSCTHRPWSRCHLCPLPSAHCPWLWCHLCPPP